MCNTCGCSNDDRDQPHAQTDHQQQQVLVDTSLLLENDHIAGHNRKIFDHHQALVINLMSSPGAGKTSLIESTVRHLGDAFKIAVIEGDLATENDAERIRDLGVQAEQICTGTACHLDADMINQVLPRFDLSTIDILFIENVGNLICPACFDLGQHRNVILLSVPEGDDKPEKYPVMFRAADLMLITKTDYLDRATGFSPPRVGTSLQRIGHAVEVMALSSQTGEGLAEWLDWLLATCHRIINSPVTSDASQPPITGTAMSAPRTDGQ